MASQTAPQEIRRVARRPNEEAIFSAALQAFSTSGFNGASMRDIAARAGTSLSNMYNYVPTKDHLLAHVLRRANDDLLASVQSALADAVDTPTERLRAAVTAYVSWSIRERTAGVVALGEFRYLRGDLRETVVAARDRTEHTFTRIVQEGVRAGEFGTPYPKEAARNIVLACATLASWYRPGGRRSPRQMAKTQTRLALATVEAAELS